MIQVTITKLFPAKMLSSLKKEKKQNSVALSRWRTRLGHVCRQMTGSAGTIVQKRPALSGRLTTGTLVTEDYPD